MARPRTITDRELTLALLGRQLLLERQRCSAVEAVKRLVALQPGIRAPLPPEEIAPPVRFLPKWDAALISHRDRSHVLPSAIADRLLGARNGEVPRTYLVDGTVAGTWSDALDGDVATLALASLIGTGPDAVPGDLEAEGERLLRLLHPEARERRVELTSA